MTRAFRTAEEASNDGADAALREVADLKVRRFLAYNKTFSCTEIEIGGSARFYGTPNRGSAPKCKGPARILDIDEMGTTAKYQNQSFKVARYCVPKSVDEEKLGGVDGTPGLRASEDRHRSSVLEPD